MERAKRQASKVQDFRKFHRSGDIPEGTVAATIRRLESPAKLNEHQHLDNSECDPVCQRKFNFENTSLATHLDNTSCEHQHDHVEHNRSELKRNSYHGSSDADYVTDRGTSVTDNTILSPTRVSTHKTNSISVLPQANTTQATLSLLGTIHNEHNYTTMSEKEKELLAQLEQQKQESNKLQQQLAELQIESQIAIEKQKQEQWSVAIQKIKEVQDQAKEQHEAQLSSIQEMIKVAANPGEADLLEKLRQVLHKESEEDKQARLAQEAEHKKNRDLVDSLMAQQKQLQEQATAMQGLNMDEESRVLLSTILTKNGNSGPSTSQENTNRGGVQQEQQLIEQLKRTLGIKEAGSEDPQKAILKQFLTKSNSINGPGGTTTLKSQLLKQLAGEEEDFNMAEWLSLFNKQEQGELWGDIDDEGRGRASRSGILDKATSNIQHKEIWLQKNLLEDWADEEVSFNQLLFEHYVAGEARTIELCTEPAQIFGRLKLIRRIAYAKLRGYEWHLIRKMYAAILTSIEARENTWESNFDRFENILYRRLHKNPKDKEVKKWYCRDYNRPEGCSRQSPHKAPVGAAGIIKTVLHICAACWMKDKAEKKHPEGHETCPHRD